MSVDKAREWKLPLKTLIINSDFDRPDGVHVIEYSAFNQATYELDKAREQRDKALAERDRLQDALDFERRGRG